MSLKAIAGGKVESDSRSQFAKKTLKIIRKLSSKKSRSKANIPMKNLDTSMVMDAIDKGKLAIIRIRNLLKRKDTFLNEKALASIAKLFHR